ncbi:MAG: rod shape-determining protein MreC [Candidatus Aminicenantes bacterium]|nr:rod shape-determining protein MreC [Candidatus Aminicenantes bacterium]
MPLWEKRRSALILTGLVVFHGLVISIQVPQGSAKSYFERGVFFVFSPVQRLATGTVRGVVSLWNNYFDLRAVRRENVELKRQNFFISQDVRFLEDRLGLAGSEAKLRESLAAFEGSIVAARTIGVDSVNPHHSIVIDKGSLDGISRNMAVCDRNGALVGRTIDPVGLKETKVQLVTDKDSSVSVRSAVAQLTGSMAGLSREVCELRYVLASAAGGQEGEELRTTGYDKIYPAGIRVGFIQSLVRDEKSPIFLRILVKPFFGFDTVDVVAVLTRGPGGGG